MTRVIWQTEDNKIYIGFQALSYVVPVREFKTFAEFVAYVQHYQAELIMYYDFIQHILAQGMIKPSPVESFVNSLEVIDNVK